MDSRLSKSKYDVAEFEGYVKARVLSNYWRLPENVRVSIGIDDCTQDALMALHEDLNVNKNFDKNRSGLTTYIYIVVDSYFNKLLKSVFSKKRKAMLIPIEIIVKQPAVEENATSSIRLREAKEKVTEFHLNASPELIDFIADNLYYRTTKHLKIDHSPGDYKIVMHPYTNKPRRLRCTKGEIYTKRKTEFRQLASRMGVTIDHYRLALNSELH